MFSWVDFRPQMNAGLVMQVNVEGNQSNVDKL